MTERAHRGIDHVVVRTDDAAALHEMFSVALGLPVTWPLQRASFATFGWIGLGNTNLEIWEAADNADLPADGPFPLIHQIALEPLELSETLDRLTANGLHCKAPRTYVSKEAGGTERLNFTNSVILDLSDSACCVFVCEWGREAAIVPWARGLSTQERRTIERDALTACAGGPLGLVGLHAISVASPDLAGATDTWQRLAGSAGPCIAIADGIAVALSEGPRTLIRSLSLAVRDVAAARRFLLGRDLLDADEDDGVVLSKRATGGLTFRLVEATSA